MKLVFGASPLGMHRLAVRTNDGCLGFRIMYPTEVTYIPANYCVSELALEKSKQSKDETKSIIFAPLKTCR